ncbi:hypothetical protein [Streptomyces sp. TUS-ST3]|uniref:hypothetical protein n=1 Tax=Streptomyces sp. TUS-ST3 TaxID=3025591 RepID=UPI0024E0C26A|nr:hypothetical protein [Streptomyces sp. TUS-ST3]
MTAGFGEQVAAVEAAVLVHDEHGDGDGRQADIAPTTAAGGLTGRILRAANFRCRHRRWR